MAFIEVGKQYKLARHISQPVGKVVDHNIVTQEVTVQWNDTDLIPPTQTYSEWEFLSNFDPIVGTNKYGSVGGSSTCFHDWKEYQGFKENYDYCTKCDQKRFKTIDN